MFTFSQLTCLSLSVWHWMTICLQLLKYESVEAVPPSFRFSVSSPRVRASDLLCLLRSRSSTTHPVGSTRGPIPQPCTQFPTSCGARDQPLSLASLWTSRKAKRLAFPGTKDKPAAPHEKSPTGVLPDFPFILIKPWKQFWIKNKLLKFYFNGDVFCCCHAAIAFWCWAAVVMGSTT